MSLEERSTMIDEMDAMTHDELGNTGPWHLFLWFLLVVLRGCHVHYRPYCALRGSGHSGWCRGPSLYLYLFFSVIMFEDKCEYDQY